MSPYSQHILSLPRSFCIGCLRILVWTDHCQGDHLALPVFEHPPRSTEGMKGQGVEPETGKEAPMSFEPGGRIGVEMKGMSLK